MSEYVDFSGRFNTPTLPQRQQGQLVYAYFEVRPGNRRSQARLPLNFSLVLDKSGSMSGARIDSLRAAVRRLIERLTPEDVVSLVAFNRNAELLAAPTPVGDKATLLRAVQKLQAAGLTRIASGLQMGLDNIAQYDSPQRLNRIVLLTDGQTDGVDECRQQARRAGQMGVPLIALGLGNDWNEDLLEELTTLAAPPGYADQIKTPEDVDKVFGEVLSQMSVIAQQVAFTLRLVQGVEARRVWQVTPLIRDVTRAAVQGRTVAVELSDLAETGAALLVELIVPPRAPGRYRMAQAELSYQAPGANPPERKERVDMLLDMSNDPNAYMAADTQIMNVVERVTAFHLQTVALDEAAIGNIAGATQKLRQAHTRLLNQGELELAEAVLAEAQRLEQGQAISDGGKKTIKLGGRKTVRLSDLDQPDDLRK